MILRLRKYIPYLIAIIVLIVGYVIKAKEKLTKIDTRGASLSKEQADIKAHELLQSMQDFGTDESTIISILRSITPQDYRLIYVSFGLEPYLWFGTAPSWLGIPMDLNGWLKREITINNDKIKKIIENAGFTF